MTIDLTPIVRHPAAVTLAARFADAGVPLYVVGGAVRDLAAGSTDAPKDLDFTTPATPDQIVELLTGLGTLWEGGAGFGTIGVDIDGMTVEVTTFRTETYQGSSRKPQVVFTDELAVDLARRDLTINTLAVSLTDQTVIDLYGGIDDLAAGVLRTPSDPTITMVDDPLRQIRVVRFAATRGFTVDPALARAIVANRDRLDIVARERITAELTKITTSGPATTAAALRSARELGLTSYLLGGLEVTDAAIATLEHLDVTDPIHPLAVLLAEQPTPASVDQLAPLILPARTCQQIVEQADDVRRLERTDAADLPAVRTLARELGRDRLRAGATFTAARGTRGTQVAAEAVGQLDRYPQLSRPLPVTGHDAMSAGLRGRDVGHGLQAVTNALIDDPWLTVEQSREVLARTAALTA